MKKCLISLILILAVCSQGFAATKVIEWKYENNLSDTSGNGITGNPYGTAAYATGVSGQAFSSDGTNCVYKTSISTAVLPVLAADTWSVNVWVYPDSTPGDWRIAWCLGAKPGAGNQSRALYSSSSGNIIFTDGVGSYLSTNSPWEVGVWQMITTTYDGSRVRVYKNGSLIGAKDFTFSDAVGEVRTPSYAWGSSNFFIGKFDEFTVYRGALSEQEIVDLIIPGVVSYEPRVEYAYYTMDDPCESTSKMPDHSGNGNDADLYGYSSPISNWLDGGIRGDYSLLFDGGQAVDMPMTVTVSQLPQYTVAFWLKSGYQPYTSAFYDEKGGSGNGSEFIVRANESDFQIYSKDRWYQTVYTITLDGTDYLDATWHHIAVVADEGANSVSVYLDGEFAGATDYLITNTKDSSDMAGHLGYSESGYEFLGKEGYLPAYIDDFHIFKGLMNADEIAIMASKADFDGDYDIDFTDLGVMAADWLDDTSSVLQPDSVVDDMESGIANWAVYVSSTYPGTGTIISTANAYEGSAAMQWDYNLPVTAEADNYTSILTDLGAATDFSSYDFLSLQLYRHAGNGEESLLFVKFADGSQNVKGEGWILDSNCVNDPAGQWDKWLIDLDYLKGEGGNGTATSDDLTAIRYIVIGCGSWERNDARTGTIDIDDIKFGMYTQCTPPLDGDLTGDCKVNFDDYVLFAEDWLPLD